RACEDSPAASGISRALQRQMGAHQLGRCLRAHRQAGEGRPRQELHQPQQGRPARQPLDVDGIPGGLRDHQRDCVYHLQGRAQHGDGGLRQPSKILTRPTVASLAPTFGRGAMTNTWADIKNTNLVVIMGGNAAEAHPCGFKWVTEAKHYNKAKLIVVDPRFTRSAAMADLFMQIRPGTDIAWLGGVINYLLANDRIQKDYVVNYTNAAFIVKDGFDFKDGLFTGYNAEKRDYDRSSWDYVIGDDGFAKVDPTLQDPRCVYQLMKAFYTRYTP